MVVDSDNRQQFTVGYMIYTILGVLFSKHQKRTSYYIITKYGFGFRQGMCHKLYFSRELEDFYSISYAWYGLINLLICVTLGNIISVITNLICHGMDSLCLYKHKTTK